MDNNKSPLVENPHGLGIFKTLYLFFHDQKFPKTAESFLEEWGLDRGEIEKVSNASLLLTRCKCSKNQANQTELKPANTKYKTNWLEGSFQTEDFQLKPDSTNVFYVCDHCHKKIKVDKVETRNEQLETIHQKKSIPHHERKLKDKFSQLQEEHQKLIAVTSELTNALQMNIIGQTKNIYAVLDQCKAIYPTLFDNNYPKVQIHEDDDQCPIETLHLNKSKDVARSTQCSKSAPPQQTHFEELNLEDLIPISPTSLAPETVRYVLELVFERIFEIDKNISYEPAGKSPTLNKGEVERIVDEVLTQSMKSPVDFGAGQGDSRPHSVSRFRNQNNFQHIDFGRLKSDLIYGDNERKIRILQALRWRITKNDGATREKVLESYATNDILDLFEAVSIPERFLLGHGMDHYVQESTCRFINALASLRQGRDYLTIDNRLLKRVLIKKVKDVRTVSGAVIRNMLVASVQKLSIRKQCRNQMVTEGLFEILIDYLDEFYEKLSKYCLEYCSALLMNLCLVEEAKHRSIKNPKKVVRLLSRFLDTENEFCLPYINGAMFSLFEQPEIASEAKNQNLDKAIIKFSQITSNIHIKKQLDFILQSRIFGRNGQNIQEEDEDSKDEVDLLEAELDQDDYITQLPTGEKLLEEYKTDSIALSPMRKDPPNSAKSFSEETKQYVHKPSVERGIFEPTKARKYTIWSQNLKTNDTGKRTFGQNYGRYPSTPLCYMETCHKMQNGGECTCSKCSPSQNKYSCGCYEAIRKDIGTVGDIPRRKNVDAKNGW